MPPPQEPEDVDGREELVGALRALPPRQRAAVSLATAMTLRYLFGT